MVGAVGSSPYYPPAGAGRTTGGLDAQLARGEKQLSEWTRCSSAKTAEGKQKIQELSDRISEIKFRIDGLEKNKLQHQPAGEEPSVIMASQPQRASGYGANDRAGRIIDVLA